MSGSNDNASDVTWGNRRVSVTRPVAASAAELFAILADPAQHAVIDGSGTVTASAQGSTKLEMGSTFGMKMKLGVPYSISNEVVEFEPDRLIAWRHMGGHRWRYAFEPTGDGSCIVTETFDWSTSRLPLLIQVMGQDRKHVDNMRRTLERLDRLATTGSPEA
jgi:hypothetical protein